MTGSDAPRAPTLDSLFGLHGRVALVTGSSRGLGQAMAVALAAAGAHVIVNSRDSAAIAAVAFEINEAGLSASPLAFDVGDSGARVAAMDEIGRRWSRLDILINNVGIRHRARIDDLSIDAFNHMFAVHVTAGFALAKLAAPLMRRNNYGRIIMITSVAATLARAGDAAYHAAKGGLSSLTRAFACEFGPDGITCNAIAPGLFATEANEALLSDPGAQSSIRASTPMKRWAEPREIGGAAVFLASPAAAFVTGHVLTVDGGMSIQV